LSILSDREIKLLCQPNGNSDFIPMIEPYFPQQVKTRTTDGTIQKIVSFGQSSAGYDVRLDRQFKIFKNTQAQLIDPLDMKNNYYDDHEGDFCIIPANGYILGITMETFHIPRDIIVISVGKSTLSRCGAVANITPIEPGWVGKIVIEVSNGSSVPLKVYAGMGISQFIFHRLSSPCEISYDDRKGKYQGQTNLQTALV